MSFGGKTVVVTGGSSGIGRAIALAFARNGARVVIGARSAQPKAGEYGESPEVPVVDLLEREGRQAIFQAVDVTDPADMGELAELAISRFGSLDVWVNNAGAVCAQKQFWEYADAELEAMLGVNTYGIWHGMRAAADRMLGRNGGGAIVNVLSTAGLRAHAGQAPYNMAKAAAAQATLCAALELGPLGIRVNGVCPTVTKTAISRPFVESEPFTRWFRGVVPLGRAVEAGEVADAVLFLASDAARSITGALLPVDSGEVLGPPSVGEILM